MFQNVSLPSFYVHVVELSERHKRELTLHLLMAHITFNGKIVIAVKGDAMIY
jgi:hypothetical protein